MLNDWSHKVRAILKKYFPPHKVRGIRDFILATKSSVWIIICYTDTEIEIPGREDEDVCSLLI